MTLASGQTHRGVKSSKTQKRSSTFKMGQDLVHLERFLFFGRYSLRNWFQYYIAKCCEILQDFEIVTILSEKTPVEKLTEGQPKKRRLDVRGSSIINVTRSVFERTGVHVRLYFSGEGRQCFIC